MTDQQFPPDGKKPTSSAQVSLSPENSPLSSQEFAPNYEFGNALFNLIGAVGLAINAQGEILRMNTAAEQFMGYSTDDVLKQPYFWERFIPEDERSRIHDLFNAIHTHSIPAHNENHWISRSGEKRLFHWLNTIIDSADGHPSYLITIGIDITEQKAVEQALRDESAKNHALLQHASDGIHILNEDGTLIEASHQFCAMLGYSCQEMIGMHPSDWDVGLNSEQLANIIKHQLANPETTTFKTHHRRKDGSVFPVEVTGVPIELHGTRVLFNSARDISQRKAIETSLNNSLHRAEQLSQFNILLAKTSEIIARAQDENAMLQALCESIAEADDLRVVRIARPDDQGTFQTLAEAGTTEFLRELRTTPMAEQDALDLLTRAWQDQQPIYNVPITKAHPLQPWLERANEFGIHAVSSLPIYRQNKIWAVLTVYYGEERMFSLLQKVLLDMTNNISFGLDRLETSRKKQNASAFNTALLDSLMAGVNVMRYPERIIERINQRMLKLIGASSISQLIAHHAREFYPDDATYQKVGAFTEQVLRDGYGTLRDVVYRRLDGTSIYMDLSGQRLQETDGIQRIVWTHVDVTERRANEQAIRDLSQLRAALLDNTTAAIDLVRYPERVVIEVNQAFIDIMGYASRDDIVGKPTDLFYFDEAEHQRIFKVAQQVLANGRGNLHDLHVRRNDGQALYIDLSGQRIEGEAPDHPVIVWTSVDVTERHRLTEELAHQALFDKLTDLPNRRALDMEISKAMSRTQRHEQLLAVVMMDLDGFKPINDIYGHDAGDQVLQVLGRRLQATLRRTDFVARLGGDEFVLLIEDARDLNEIAPILDKIRLAVREPIALKDNSVVSIDLSAGVCVYPIVDTDNPDALLRYADMGLYESKAHKEDRLRYWSLYGEKIPHINKKAKQLLQNGGLRVYYQPVLDSRSNTIVGIEALARLQDDAGRILPPAEFLPLMNVESLFELSCQVLQQALSDLKILEADGHPLWVSVNIDPCSISEKLVSRVRDLLHLADIAPQRISLEILEGNEFENHQLSKDHLLALKTTGVQLALDDVGSAYSSLLRIKELPIDKIKLDQGFVRTLTKQQEGLYFVQAMHDLATDLGLELVVEGVENEDILDALVIMNVSLLQGYAIAYPLPLAELRTFLRQPPPHRQHPTSLFGIYAGQITNINVLKKAISQQSSMMNQTSLADSTACPVHAHMQRLGLLEDHPLQQLHHEFHQALAKMLSATLASSQKPDWSSVDNINKRFMDAIMTEYQQQDE